jgi:predicted ATPase
MQVGVAGGYALVGREEAAARADRDARRQRVRCGAGTYEAVCQLLRYAARSRPLLVVLEDLHWADASSLGLLDYAVSALAPDPVQFVVTRRPASTVAADPLGPTMAALARNRARRISLGGLAGSEVGDLSRS